MNNLSIEKRKFGGKNIQCENYFNIYCNVMVTLIKSESCICCYYWSKVKTALFLTKADTFIFVEYLSSRPSVVKELSDKFIKKLSANWLGLHYVKCGYL